MAGVSMKEIKSRIKSMESSKQITKAMQMVAASKLRAAQERAVSSRPYFEILYETMSSIAEGTENFASPYLRPQEGGRQLFIVIAGDRGLAGGYNSNVLKLAYAQMDPENAIVLPIGKKSADFFRSRGVEILMQDYETAADISIGDCYSLANILCEDYLSGKYAAIKLVYTNFVSLLEQTPVFLPMLPVPITETHSQQRTPFVLYEVGAAGTFHAIVPEYLGGVLYGALVESLASEQASRRMAMDAATKNAEDMISDLSLKYNRARQGAITQEITEIVAGAENT